MKYPEISVLEVCKENKTALLSVDNKLLTAYLFEDGDFSFENDMDFSEEELQYVDQFILEKCDGTIWNHIFTN